MTNIWAQTFEEIRKPHFEMEDPHAPLNEKKEEKKEEGKAKRWWDDDGDGVGYEPGEVSGKFKKKKVKEEVEEIEEASPIYGRGGEQLDEISLKTKMKAYAASRDVDADYVHGNKVHSQGDRIKANIVKKHGEKAGEHAERHAEVSNFGRGTPRAKPRIEKNRTYRTTKAGKMHGQDQAKLKRDLEYRRSSRNEETLVEVEKKNDSKEKKIDVMSGKNKIAINPQIKEEVEAWVSELVEEGYDLSEFTWDEMTDIYIDEMSEGTADMPPRGDAETVSVTNPQLASAKRRAAQTQIAADMARIKLQRTSAMTKESVDSIVEYLSQRNDAFENLEEAVFDPKRTRMRPASERTARVMTAAQRTAAKKEAERVAAIHSKGETVLAGMRTQGKRGKVKTTPDAKPAPPEANRTVKGRYDKLAKAASEVLKKTQR